MFVCMKCKSKKIKTRTNRLFGTKSVTTAVLCKDCNSTDIENIKPDQRRFRKR